MRVMSFSYLASCSCAIFCGCKENHQFLVFAGHRLGCAVTGEAVTPPSLAQLDEANKTIGGHELFNKDFLKDPGQHHNYNKSKPPEVEELRGSSFSSGNQLYEPMCEVCLPLRHFSVDPFLAEHTPSASASSNGASHRTNICQPSLTSTCLKIPPSTLPLTCLAGWVRLCPL